jgi:hypothetical protein
MPATLILEDVAAHLAMATLAPVQAAATLAASGSNLALTVGIVLVALGLLAAALIWLAHRLSLSRTERLIKEFRSRSVEVMDRLDALKERLKLLSKHDPDFREPISGETLALYDSVQARLAKQWDRWLEIMEALEKAQKLAGETVSPLDQKKLYVAEDLLQSKETFGAIEKEADSCAALMERLSRAHEAAREVLAAAKASQATLVEKIAAVASVDLPTDPYADQLSATQAGLARAESSLTADPIGAVTFLEQLTVRREKLLERVTRVVTLSGAAGQLRDALESVRREAAECRAGGLALAEDGGNPDHMLGQAARLQGEALADLRAGEPDAANQKLDAARAQIQQGSATIEEVKKAREFCRREQAARVQETERLRAGLPAAETHEQELRRAFAPASWQAVAPNLAQSRALLGSFDRLAADAAAAASSTSQKYLEGARTLVQLAQKQQNVNRLISGVSEQLSALRAVRSECERARGELEARSREVEAVLSRNAASVGDVARNTFAAAVGAREPLVRRFGEPCPDWPAIGQDLTRALEELAIARSQAETDVHQHQQLKEEFRRARQTADRVYALLAGHREDRPAANQHYHAGADALDRVGVDIEAPRGESARLLEQVQGAATDLETAQRMAQEDIRLAAQAQAELTEATRALRKARTFFSLGVTVESSAAEAELRQADQCLRDQEYEQAIRHAGASMGAIRLAQHSAVQEAQRRQIEQDAELRRRSAGYTTAPAPNVSFGTMLAGAAANVIVDQLRKAATAASREAAVDSRLVPEATHPAPAVSFSSRDDPQAAG